MPIRPDGSGRDPIDPGTRVELATALRNALLHGATLDQALIDRIGQSVGGNIDNSDNLAIWNIARAEQRAINAANTVNQNPGNQPPANIFPVVPGDPADAGLFVYDVLVVATDASGNPFTDRFTITSPDPLSADDVQQMIEDNAQRYFNQMRSPGPAVGPPGSFTITTTILGAGRVR